MKKIVKVIGVFVLTFSFFVTSIYANGDIVSEEQNTVTEEVDVATDENEVVEQESQELQESQEPQESQDLEEMEVEDISIEEYQQVDITPTEGTISLLAQFQEEFQNAEDGDTVVISAELAGEVTSLNQPIRLVVAADDTRNITIDGSGVTIDGLGAYTSTLLNIAHSGSGVITVQNVTIQNLVNRAIETSGNGSISFSNVSIKSVLHAIYSNTKGNLRIDNSTFTETKGFVDNVSDVPHNVTISNTLFSKSEEHAVFINSNAIATISNSSFMNNEGYIGYNGGAVRTRPEGANINLVVANCYFYGNISKSATGGALSIYHLSNGTVSIKNSLFEENLAQGGAGISVADGGAVSIKNNAVNFANTTVTISGNTFKNNTADDNGGAMMVEASNGGTTKAIIYNNTFVDNKANNLGSKTGGGAIQTYETPETIISHNTFYRNDSLNNTNGGAIMMHGNWRSSGVISPTIANNIFADNNAYRGENNSNNVAKYFSVTANVSNNGNVGYDLGQKFIPDDAERNALVTVENIFAETTLEGDRVVAVPITLSGLVGSTGNTATRTAYVPSPRTDEMLRTNDPRTTTGVLTDVRGYPREALTAENPYYPNAGAVEIYWTKFDPGTASGLGSWSSRLDVEAEGGIKSLAYPGVFYKINNPPTYVNGSPVYEQNLTFTRNTLVGAEDYGFVSWYDEAKNESKDVNENYEARKQTYVAVWEQDVVNLDFNLMGGQAQVGHEQDFATQKISLLGDSLLGAEPNSVPVKDGLVFAGWFTDDVTFETEWNFATDEVRVDTTLYAKWEAIPKYTVVYDGNCDDSQNVAIDLNEYEAGNIVVVSTEIPTRSGYRFMGWNSQADGLGITYGSTFLMPAENVVLYAKWELITLYNVVYDGNAVGVENIPVDTNSYDVGELVTISTVQPTRVGYTFKGWNSQADGLGITYGETFPMPARSVTLYAMWSENITPIDPITPSTPKEEVNAGVSSNNSNVILLASLMGLSAFALIAIKAFKKKEW